MSGGWCSCSVVPLRTQALLFLLPWTWHPLPSCWSPMVQHGLPQMRTYICVPGARDGEQLVAMTSAAFLHREKSLPKPWGAGAVGEAALSTGGGACEDGPAVRPCQAFPGSFPLAAPPGKQESTWNKVCVGVHVAKWPWCGGSHCACRRWAQRVRRAAPCTSVPLAPAQLCTQELHQELLTRPRWVSPLRGV